MSAKKQLQLLRSSGMQSFYTLISITKDINFNFFVKKSGIYQGWKSTTFPWRPNKRHWERRERQTYFWTRRMTNCKIENIANKWDFCWLHLTFSGPRKLESEQNFNFAIEKIKPVINLKNESNGLHQHWPFSFISNLHRITVWNTGTSWRQGFLE